MRVTPRRLPFTATQITADNMTALAKKHERELWATDADTFID